MPTKSAAPKSAKPKAGTAKSVNATASKNEAKPAAPRVETDAAVEVVAEGAKVSLSLRVKDLIERVAAAGDFARKDVRDIVSATLVELGKALEAGESLNLPPFGKMQIRNSRSIENGMSAMTLKVRRGPTKQDAPQEEKEGLAEAHEAG